MSPIQDYKLDLWLKCYLIFGSGAHLRGLYGTYIAHLRTLLFTRSTCVPNLGVIGIEIATSSMCTHIHTYIQTFTHIAGSDTLFVYFVVEVKIKNIFYVLPNLRHTRYLFLFFHGE